VVCLEGYIDDIYTQVSNRAHVEWGNASACANYTTREAQPSNTSISIAANIGGTSAGQDSA
jgi:hypothetical protein